MVARDTLVRDLDAYLDPETMPDYGPNGIQVEGRSEIDSIVLGVTASLNMIEATIAQGADALLVHHGVLWQHDGARAIKGWHGARIKRLIENDINLISYHLPLDMHAVVGNNACILDGLGLKADGRFGKDDIGFTAKLPKGTKASGLVQKLGGLLGSPPVHIHGGGEDVTRIGVVSGAGQRFLEDAVAADCDFYVTGEASEFVTHVARETGTHYAWAGHHHTETLGVQALGAWIRDRFDVSTTFIDDPNPV